jgi:DNA repair protein RadD
MSFEPRPYQSEAHQAAITHAKKSLEPQVLSLPCGSGKSQIISMIAKDLHEMSGKRILITAPSAKLCMQDHAKYLNYGLKASVYSASAGRKELRHPVVFGTVITLLNSKEKLSGFAAVIIDESHSLTRSLLTLIDHLKADNENFRIIGLSATPYRYGMGWCFEAHYQKGYMQDTHKPYFKLCTYDISTRELIDQGYLTPVINGTNELHYDTEALELDKKGHWTDESLNTVFLSGQERLTAEIVAYVVQVTEHYNSVMFFGSTIKHCEEIMLSLPPELSRMVTGDTPGRARIEHDFEKLKFKYLVSVNTMLVGVDFPAVDCLAVLRKTESKGLFQQLIGRGTRLYPGKKHCLLLDFADNTTNYIGKDLFEVDIRSKEKKPREKIAAVCPECNHQNLFAARDNDAGYKINENGLFLWPDNGEIVQDEEGRPYPAHFGRRCFGVIGRTDRCNYRWSFKPCQSCEHENDIAARACEKCKAELIDPNEKLKLEAKAKAEAHMKEPILNVTLENEWRGDKRIKVAIVKTLFGKQIRIFMHVANEKDRDRFRLFRDNDLTDKQIEFYRKQNKGYYTFIGVK